MQTPRPKFFPFTWKIKYASVRYSFCAARKHIGSLERKHRFLFLRSKRASCNFSAFSTFSASIFRPFRYLSVLAVCLLHRFHVSSTLWACLEHRSITTPLIYRARHTHLSRRWSMSSAPSAFFVLPVLYRYSSLVRTCCYGHALVL